MLPTYKMNKPCESRLKRSESAYLKEYFDHLETTKKSSAFVEVLSKEKEIAEMILLLGVILLMFVFMVFVY